MSNWSTYITEQGKVLFEFIIDEGESADCSKVSDPIGRGCSPLDWGITQAGVFHNNFGLFGGDIIHAKGGQTRKVIHSILFAGQLLGLIHDLLLAFHIHFGNLPFQALSFFLDGEGLEVGIGLHDKSQGVRVSKKVLVDQWFEERAFLKLDSEAINMLNRNGNLVDIDDSKDCSSCYLVDLKQINRVSSIKPSRGDTVHDR